MWEISVSKVQAYRSYSWKKLFKIFLKCTIVSDIYENLSFLKNSVFQGGSPAQCLGRGAGGRLKPRWELTSQWGAMAPLHRVLPNRDGWEGAPLTSQKFAHPPYHLKNPPPSRLSPPNLYSPHQRLITPLSPPPPPPHKITIFTL